MKKLFTLFAFVIIGLTACQETKESVIQQEQQITERHSCCDTTKLETLLLYDWTSQSYDSIKGITLPFIGQSPMEYYQQPCDTGCEPFDNDAVVCDENAIVDCLNTDVNQCEQKTALSQWICLGEVTCLEEYCHVNSPGFSPNYFWQGNNCNGTSGLYAFFQINPIQYCEIMDCVSQMGIDYLYDNRTLYTCNNNTRPIIEYQLVAKNGWYGNDDNSCKCYSGYEEYPGYNAELWIKIWCCND